MTWRQFFHLVLLVWNLIVFFLYAWDKYRAVRGEWRVSEKSLLLMAVCFGGLGAGISAHLCHHKTKKWYFHLAWWLGSLFTLYLAYLLFVN